MPECSPITVTPHQLKSSLCKPGTCDDVVKVFGERDESELMNIFQTTDKKLKKVDDMSIHDLEIELLKKKLDYLQPRLKQSPDN